jgi:hypothetical protein
MDFHKLLNDISAIDKGISECGGDMTPHAPPTVSVNLSAQGIDNIANLMSLLVKVNPDMMPQTDKQHVSMKSDPALNFKVEPLKSLPSPSDMDRLDTDDLDNFELMGNDEIEDEGAIGSAIGSAVGAAAGPVGSFVGGKIGDAVTGEDFENATTKPDEKYFDTDHIENTLSGGPNRKQHMSKHSYKQGDNPIAMPESSALVGDTNKKHVKYNFQHGNNPMSVPESLQDKIRNDLRARLAEAKSR